VNLRFLELLVLEPSILSVVFDSEETVAVVVIGNETEITIADGTMIRVQLID
jgi:hypothetical protein